MKVYLDDERITPEGWFRTNTVAETIAALQPNIKSLYVTELSLDHDLGDNHFTGYSVLLWIEGILAEGTIPFHLPKIYIHTANTSIRIKMEAALASIEKMYAKINSHTRKIKQVIVVRKDLNMQPGKMGAQIAHASMGVFFNKMERNKGDSKLYHCDFTQQMESWKDGTFTKIIVWCDSEEDLKKLEQKANGKNIPNCLIRDNGETVFKEVCLLCHGSGDIGGIEPVACHVCKGTGKINKPTYTCIAIGPDYADVIDEITKRLRLI